MRIIEHFDYETETTFCLSTLSTTLESHAAEEMHRFLRTLERKRMRFEENRFDFHPAVLMRDGV